MTFPQHGPHTAPSRCPSPRRTDVCAARLCSFTRSRGERPHSVFLRPCARAPPPAAGRSPAATRLAPLCSRHLRGAREPGRMTGSRPWLQSSETRVQGGHVPSPLSALVSSAASSCSLGHRVIESTRSTQRGAWHAMVAQKSSSVVADSPARGSHPASLMLGARRETPKLPQAPPGTARQVVPQGLRASDRPASQRLSTAPPSVRRGKWLGFQVISTPEPQRQAQAASSCIPRPGQVRKE